MRKNLNLFNMKRFIITVLALSVSMGAVDVTAQSFLKKVGKAVGSEVKKELVNQMKDGGKSSETTKSQPAKEQAQPAQQKQQPAAAKPQQKQTATKTPDAATQAYVSTFYKPVEKLSSAAKVVKDITLYYSGGRVVDTYKLYKDGNTYYVEMSKGKYHEVFSCDALLCDVKYNHFCKDLDIELYIKEKLAGTPAPTEVRRDPELRKR